MSLRLAFSSNAYLDVPVDRAIDRIAAAGNQGFHNRGLFSAGLPGETYHWSVQAIDKGFRGSLWVDGQDFTIQPLQPHLLSDTNPLLQGQPLSASGQALSGETEVVIDLDSDGLRDRIRYDAGSRRLLVEQGAGGDGTTWRPFLGPTGALIANVPTFLAGLPVAASDTPLQVVDRSFLADSAEGQWTLSVDLDGPGGSTATEQVLTSFRSGDPLGADLDLAGDLLTRQRYRLMDVPTEVQLFLNGQDVRAALGDGKHANLSFTLEDARSGALRFLFRDPAAASAGDITLKLVPANGSGPARYNLRLQDRGDGRPDHVGSKHPSEDDGATLGAEERAAQCGSRRDGGHPVQPLPGGQRGAQHQVGHGHANHHVQRGSQAAVHEGVADHAAGVGKHGGVVLQRVGVRQGREAPDLRKGHQ